MELSIVNLELSIVNLKGSIVNLELSIVNLKGSIVNLEISIVNLKGSIVNQGGSKDRWEIWFNNDSQICLGQKNMVSLPIPEE